MNRPLKPGPAAVRRRRAGAATLELFDTLPVQRPAEQVGELGQSVEAAAPRAAAAEKLWLCLRLPCLSLEVFACERTDLGPAVVVAGRGRDQRVATCSEAAGALGVRPGMRLGAAHALGRLRVLERDVAAEARALEALAVWAGQFTPWVSLVPAEALLLEVAGSVRLFGGVQALVERVRTGCAELGHLACVSLAPTPTAALLAARAGQSGICTARERLAGLLSDLPLQVLELPGRHLQALRDMGLARLGDLLRLPRDGLARRIDPELVQTLDRALGRLPDPRRHFEPPACFDRRVEFSCEVWTVEPIVLVARRLLLELVGFLRARGAAVQRLVWTLEYPPGSDRQAQARSGHDQRRARTREAPPGSGREAQARSGHDQRRARTLEDAPGSDRQAQARSGHDQRRTRTLEDAPGSDREAQACSGHDQHRTRTLEDAPGSDREAEDRERLTLGLVAPTRDHERLMLLTRERFERLSLRGPVRGLGLRVEEPVPLEELCGSLLREEPSGAVDEVAPLLERLRARLGAAAVKGLALVADHRPERAWQRCEPGEALSVPCSPGRPLWLLPEPIALSVRDGRPQCHGPLQAESGPERIESGWWEDGCVARDYYVVRNPAGERLWVYREIAPPRRWFLHGLFE